MTGTSKQIQEWIGKFVEDSGEHLVREMLWRVDGLVQAMGIEGISKSQVSEMARSLDGMVDSFRSRPLDQGPYRYLWLDALVIKCREGGRVAPVAALVATAVDADGRREILGLDVVTSETGAGWTAFLRGLVSRGLSGVELVTSDAHPGLKDAIAATLPGASWQRCRTHFLQNLLTRVPKSLQQAAPMTTRRKNSRRSRDAAHPDQATVSYTT